MINVLLIGIGPHARRIYYPILSQIASENNLRLRAIVELKAVWGVVDTYLDNNSAASDIERLYLDEAEAAIADNTLTESATHRLSRVVKDKDITAVIVATEPTAHVAYGKWALNEGLHVLMDKPISAPADLTSSPAASRQIFTDYAELADLYRSQKLTKPTLTFQLMAQRRYHPAFHYIKDRVREVTDRTGFPITSFQSLHSDGQWRMPNEIVGQDYHPYNQGYGKCLHSGYHAIDIVAWLTRESYSGIHELSDINVSSNFLYPDDFLAQLPLEGYNALFPDFHYFNKYDEATLREKFQAYGEIDAQIALNFKHSDGRTLTLGQLSLQHNGFGQRNWPSAAGHDLYKGNGRVRHESHALTQGPFQAIYYQSYQSQEILDTTVNHSGVGGEYHLDLHIFRNNKFFPEWKAYEKVSLKDLSVNILEGYSRGHQEDARRAAVLNFIECIKHPAADNYSDLIDHELATAIIAAAYNSAYNSKHGLKHDVSVSRFTQRLTRDSHSVNEAKVGYEKAA